VTGKPLIEVLDDCSEEDLAALLKAIATPCSPEVVSPAHSPLGRP